MLRFWAIAFCLLLPVDLLGRSAYSPKIANPFEESWRWSKLDFLDRYEVFLAKFGLEGSLLFGTDAGLLLYDGYEYEVYPTPPDSGTICSVYEDTSGVIFVMTDHFMYSFEDGEWTLLFEVEGPGRWQMIDASKDGSVWIASPSGLYRVKDGDLKYEETLIQNYSSVLVDQKNQLWLADSYQGIVMRYQLDEGSGAILGDPLVIHAEGDDKFTRTRLYEWSDGRIWINSLARRGALRFVEGDEVSALVDDWDHLGIGRHAEIVEGPEGALMAFSPRISAIWKDESWSFYDVDDLPISTAGPFASMSEEGTLVYGGRRDDVFAIDLSRNRSVTYDGLNFHGEDPSGRSWFLTRDKRVVYFDPSIDEWFSYGPEDGVINMPNCLTIDAAGRVWVSGSHQGVASVSWLDRGNWTRETHPDSGKLFGHLSAYESSDGAIYFGINDEVFELEDKNGGLVRYSIEEDSRSVRDLLEPAVPKRVASLVEVDSNIWFGGFGLFTRQEGAPLRMVDRFRDNWIDHMLVTRSGELWIALWGAGVFRKLDSGWQREDLLDDLSSRKYIALMDSEHWGGAYLLTGDSGLCRFDGQSWSSYSRFKHLKITREGGGLKESSDGSLWINVATRTWNFYTHDLSSVLNGSNFQAIRYRKDPHPPLSRMLVAEELMQEAGNAYFRWESTDYLNDTSKADLEHSYRINGGDWSNFSKSSDLLLQNVEAGNYTLEVRTRDSDWNEAKEMLVAQFEVKLLLWKRPWFIAAVILTILLLALLTYFLVRTRVEHLLNLKEFKLNFFTNLSHELRTPLSVVIGPLQSLKKRELGPDEQSLVDLCLRNAQKMQGLVNHLLEFRKVELGMREYRSIRSDIVLFIKNAIYHNEALWTEKKQELILHLEDQEKASSFDPGMLQSLVDNLLSNAVKYTQVGGCIEVTVGFRTEEDEGENLIFKVKDNGDGIDPSIGENVFKPFQRGTASERSSEGSGIGLAYCKEIVDIWGGEIGFESPVSQDEGPDCGVEFVVVLPIRSKGGAEGELDLTEIEETLESSGKGPNVLIVEDNPDVSDFLRIELGDEYEIETASDGREGLKRAISSIPDLIITDVMMPEMDGMELCKELKTQDETSHIPVVMLTARVSDEFKLKGIEHGADDYFPKPVNLAMLKARIEVLLESRQKLRELFGRQVVLKPKEIAVSSKDEAFLTKAISIVDEHILDESFDVDAFALLIGMSRSTLYRKLNAVSGQAPFGFIRSIRLKRAAQLLDTGEYTVSEVLERVGILDMSYFGKVFKKEFGISPSDYRKNALR